MAVRDNPYSAFNFRVKLGGINDEAATVGGFSDVSGLGNEITFAEYRNGNDKENHVRKIANTNKTDDITLKRGLVGDTRLFEWLKATREGDFNPQTVIITLHDEKHTAVAQWTLMQAQPKKWVGPTLAGKGGSEAAMEELHLVAERIDYKSL
jgi:phage tail-like protein